MEWQVGLYTLFTVFQYLCYYIVDVWSRGGEQKSSREELRATLQARSLSGSRWIQSSALECAALADHTTSTDTMRLAEGARLRVVSASGYGGTKHFELDLPAFRRHVLKWDLKETI